MKYISYRFIISNRAVTKIKTKLHQIYRRGKKFPALVSHIIKLISRKSKKECALWIGWCEKFLNFVLVIFWKEIITIWHFFLRIACGGLTKWWFLKSIMKDSPFVERLAFYSAFEQMRQPPINLSILYYNLSNSKVNF